MKAAGGRACFGGLRAERISDQFTAGEREGKAMARRRVYLSDVRKRRVLRGEAGRAWRKHNGGHPPFSTGVSQQPPLFFLTGAMRGATLQRLIIMKHCFNFGISR